MYTTKDSNQNLNALVDQTCLTRSTINLPLAHNSSTLTLTGLVRAKVILTRLPPAHKNCCLAVKKQHLRIYGKSRQLSKICYINCGELC